MKIVYIAHALAAPTREGIEENRRKAAKWVAWAALQGVAPSATWIVLTGEFDESFRKLGLEIDCALVERCDEVWFVGTTVSSGMFTEARHALLHGVKVFDRTGYKLPPENGAVVEKIPVTIDTTGYEIGADRPSLPSSPKFAVEDELP